MRASGDTLTVWTRQVPEVWDELERTGRYVACERYVRSKNDTISDFYLELYRWLTAGCRRRMDIPADLDVPIWLALTEDQKLGEVEGTVSLTLQIPRNSLFKLDYEKWGYRVNLWYVPVSPEDEKRHNDELARLGIANDALLIMGDKGNFYPALKQKVIRSWERVFEGISDDPSDNVGICWEIRRSWVTGVIRDIGTRLL